MAQIKSKQGIKIKGEIKWINLDKDRKGREKGKKERRRKKGRVIIVYCRDVPD